VLAEVLELSLKHLGGYALEAGHRLDYLLQLEVGEEFQRFGRQLLSQGQNHDSHLA